MNNFIELFSDAAATPDAGFIRDLEKQFVSAANSKPAKFRLSAKQKLLIAITLAVIVAIVTLLIFLPKRNMSDPTTNSLVEEVVDVTKESAETFSTQPDKDEAEKPVDDVVDNSESQSTATQPQNNQQDQPLNTPPTPSSPVGVNGFLASYWNLDLDSASAPSIPASTPNATNTIENIDFNWGNGSPYSGVQADGFIISFTKETSDMSGEYKVEYSSDNGLRMHVGEIVVFDHWNSASSSGTAYFTTDPAAPTTSIVIDYYEQDGPANVYVKITKVE